MGNKMLEDIQTEIISYYDHYLYLADMIKVNNHLQSILRNAKEDNKGINFLKITYAATIDSMMINFARLYEEDKKTKNIKQLIVKCRKNSNLSKNQIDLEKQLNQFEEKLSTDEYLHAVETIKMRRDKMFAHNDKKFFNNPEKDDSYLPMYKLWTLKNYTRELLTYLGKAFEISFEKQSIYNNDLNDLIE